MECKKQNSAVMRMSDFVEVGDNSGFNMTNYLGADAIKVVTWYNSLTAA